MTTMFGGAGSITGTVTDAVIANATVSIQDPVSGYNRTATTDDSGQYRFVNVPFAPYHMVIKAGGIADNISNHLRHDRRTPTAMDAALQLSVAVAVGYIALFGVAVETGAVMVVYLHEALEQRLQTGKPLTNADIEAAAMEEAVLRLRPKLMTVIAVIASLAPSFGKRALVPT